MITFEFSGAVNKICLNYEVALVIEREQRSIMKQHHNEVVVRNPSNQNNQVKKIEDKNETNMKKKNMQMEAQKKKKAGIHCLLTSRAGEVWGWGS